MASGRVGLLRVVDAVTVAESVRSSAGQQRSVDFSEADFAAVTAQDVIDDALAALHPDKPLLPAGAAPPQQRQGEWVVPPTLVAANLDAADDRAAAPGFTLPPRASLLSSGLRPSTAGGPELYLCGQWRWFVPGGHRRDVLMAAAPAGTVAAVDMSGDGDVQNALVPPSDGAGAVHAFVPSLVRVTLWSVKDRPAYEVDVRRPLPTLTCGRMKKIVAKFSGIAIESMDLDVVVSAPPGSSTSLSTSNSITVRDDGALLFPFAFDPSVVPEVRIRSRNDLVHDGAQSRHVISVLQHQQYGSSGLFIGGRGGSNDSNAADADASFALAASSAASRHSSPGRAAAARVEAEYGAGFSIRDRQFAAAAGTAVSPLPAAGSAAAGAALVLQQVAPEQSRDWAAWLEQRRTARSTHVRQVLVPSSKEQIEVERALQVRTAADVKNVSRSAVASGGSGGGGTDLASASQILQRQLAVARDEILRARIGDAAFAQGEGRRGVLAPGPSKSSAASDGVDRAPLVVTFR